THRYGPRLWATRAGDVQGLRLVWMSSKVCPSVHLASVWPDRLSGRRCHNVPPTRAHARGTEFCQRGHSAHPPPWLAAAVLPVGFRVPHPVSPNSRILSLIINTSTQIADSPSCPFAAALHPTPARPLQF